MSQQSPEIAEAINRYESGPQELRQAVGDMTPKQIATPAEPGRWSTLEVICHLSDFELVYADRMKRVIAEDRPTMFSGDPDQFAAALAYQTRDLEEELRVIESVRKQVARVLRTLPTSAFERTGTHTSDGPLTLSTLLKRITGHIPHHAEFIRQKRKALQS